VPFLSFETNKKPSLTLQARIWGEICRRARLGDRDNLGDAGGDFLDFLARVRADACGGNHVRIRPPTTGFAGSDPTGNSIPIILGGFQKALPPEFAKVINVQEQSKLHYGLLVGCGDYAMLCFAESTLIIKKP
jgi:hypothetical protein